ncbi:MAG: DMT family transporter [Burkholderiaceae bacterium]
MSAPKQFPTQANAFTRTRSHMSACWEDNRGNDSPARPGMSWRALRHAVAVPRVLPASVVRLFVPFAFSMTASTSAPTSSTGAARHAPLLVYLKLTFVALCWGGTFIAGHVVVQALPTMLGATGRFVIAVLMLFAVVWKAEGRIPRLTRRQVLQTFALGLTGIFAYNVFFFVALHLMPAGRTALFVSLNPVMTALLVATLFGERLGLRKWSGIAIAFLGAAIIIARGDLLGAARDISGSLGVGELCMLGAVFSWACYTLIGRSAMKTLSPLVATAYGSLWGLVLLAAGAVPEVSGFDWSRFSLPVIGALLYIGAFGTVIGFVWYYEGVQRIGPSRAAIFTNLVPVFGVLLAALLLNEALTLSMITGGALAVAGVTIMNLTPGKSRRAPAPSGTGRGT